MTQFSEVAKLEAFAVGSAALRGCGCIIDVYGDPHTPPWSLLSLGLYLSPAWIEEF